MSNKFELLIILLSAVALVVFLTGIIKDAKDSLRELYKNDESIAGSKDHQLHKQKA